MFEEAGIYIQGLFVASASKLRDKEVRYEYVLLNGTETYKITSSEDYTDKLAMGDLSVFKVSVNVWNNKAYFSSGKLIM